MWLRAIGFLCEKLIRYCTMRKFLTFLSLFFVLGAAANDTFSVNDFEAGPGGADNAWGGSCEWVDNPLKDSNNPSSKVLKVTSTEFAATAIPFTLPDDKTLTDYMGVRLQLAVLDACGENIHWVGCDLGVQDETGNKCWPATASWQTGVLNTWLTLDFWLDEATLSSWLSGGYTGGLSLLMKVGRQKFIYIIDNVALIEKSEYVDDGSQQYFGVNLSGAEFGGVYPGVDGTHYGYPTYKDLDYFKKKGLNLVRFPFRWERIQRTMNGELDATELAKMKTFVQAAEDRGMPVILDMHNFARYSFDGGATYALIGESPRLTAEHLADVWRKLAREFKDYTNIWGYDIMNEPYSMLPSAPWFDIAQVVIDAIREIDTETPIIVCGDSFSSARFWVEYSDNLRNLVDPYDNLIFQAHLYFDKDYSGQYLNSYDADGVTPDTGVERARYFVEWLKRYNKRGLLGEYGVPDDDSRWLETLENLLIYLRDNGVPGTYWSAGPRWGDYKLSVQPTQNYTVDRPQMSVLERYTVTTGNTSGIENSMAVSNDKLQVSSHNGEVVLAGTTSREVSVWNVSGALVCKVSVQPGCPARFTLPKGFYIVDNIKIVVK